MSEDDLQSARDRDLAERVSRGDGRAIGEFCRIYLPRLYRYVLPRVATPDDADDVVQIVLSIAARRMETFRGDSSLFSWLAAICRREAGRYAVAAARRHELFQPYEGSEGETVHAMEAPSPDMASAKWERLLSIQRCLERLPDRYAEVLELKYMDGYSSKEIASRYDITDEAVQSLLARARRAFRETCDDDLRAELTIRRETR